jgi:hypothetical protein
VRTEDALPRVVLPDGLTVAVLGPTQSRLDALRATWKEEVEIALTKGNLDEVSPGLGRTASGRLEAFGASTPPTLDTKVDLQILAEGPSPKDQSKTNATSITLLLEWEGRRILLTGDALAQDLVTALQVLGNNQPVKLDVFKVPHHGSRQNLSKDLVETIDTPYWMFSTDGTLFRHPDAPAIARILRWGRSARPTLGFNVPSTFNRWWDSDTWRSRFDYGVEYGNETDGLTLSFDPV